MSDKERVLITGSSGLIGAALCERLAPRFDVIGFDRAGPPHPPASADPIAVDLTLDSSVTEAMETLRQRHGNRLAAVVHLAAYYDFSGQPSEKYDQVTVEGTRRLLRALKRFEVGRFAFSSTMLVHAPARPGQTVNEDSPIRPTWAYPASKVRTEEVIRAERGRIPAALLRIAGVYTDQCDSLPLSNQIKRIYEGDITSRFFPGNLNAGQSLIHRDDLLDALESVIERRASLPDETALVIGEAGAVPYRTLQREIGLLVHGKPWATLRIPKPAARLGARLQALVGKGGFIQPWMIDRADDHYALDITRASQLLSWKPKRALLDTLPHMIQFLRRDPRGWYRRHRFEAPAWLPAEARLPASQTDKKLASSRR